jgi:hypothetical protein
MVSYVKWGGAPVAVTTSNSDGENPATALRVLTDKDIQTCWMPTGDLAAGKGAWIRMELPPKSEAAALCIQSGCGMLPNDACNRARLVRVRLMHSATDHTDLFYELDATSQPQYLAFPWSLNRRTPRIELQFLSKYPGTSQTLQICHLGWLSRSEALPSYLSSDMVTGYREVKVNWEWEDCGQTEVKCTEFFHANLERDQDEPYSGYYQCIDSLHLEVMDAGGKPRFRKTYPRSAFTAYDNEVMKQVSVRYCNPDSMWLALDFELELREDTDVQGSQRSWLLDRYGNVVHNMEDLQMSVLGDQLVSRMASSKPHWAWDVERHQWIQFQGHPLAGLPREGETHLLVGDGIGLSIRVVSTDNDDFERGTAEVVAVDLRKGTITKRWQFPCYIDSLWRTVHHSADQDGLHIIANENSSFLSWEEVRQAMGR